MTIANHLKKFLDESGIHYVSLYHPESFTSQQTAETMHVPGREMAKTVIVKHGDGYMMAVLEAPDHIDLEKLKAFVKRDDLMLASEGDFENIFRDCQTGAMPPFGNLYDMPVYVEEKLEEDDDIVFNAGTHTEAIRMKYKDYKKLVRPKIGPFATT